MQMPRGNDDMGQAKLRGDYELRKAQAIERNKLEAISKQASKEYKAYMRAKYLAENPAEYERVQKEDKRIARARMLLTSALGMAVTSWP
jgi:uncharacterized membrane protein (DUF106 family)